MPNINELPATGFVRLNQILGPKGPLPICRSSWYAGQRDGRFPKPIPLGPRAVGYRVEEIRALIESFDNASPQTINSAPTSVVDGSNGEDR